jgi:murein DD-endopeptidase MepM/ murein hydrolase activator NlpD
MRKQFKQARSAKKKQGFFARLVTRIFCPRSIIIIADHKTGHVPLSVTKQLGVVAVVLGAVAWVSFSTGNYVAAQEKIAEKDRRLASKSLENHRIESEFSLLKRDLLSMMDQGGEGEMSEYAQFILDQYKNGTKAEDIAIDVDQLGESKHGAIFQRIAYLEGQVDELKNRHDAVINVIRETADNRISDLEEIVRTTGLSGKKLERRAESKVSDKFDRDARGGPFNPLEEQAFEDYDSLLNDIRRLVVLDEVVKTLPIDEPMNNYHISSGYGVRVDPFRKRPARHTGLDFVGRSGAPIHATSDGVVTFSGRKGAYGLMVDVDHGLQLSTRYGHMSKLLVKDGQKVKKGDILGLQGSTGRSTGAHLHYEVRFEGATFDPKTFLKAGEYVREKNNGG